MEQNDQQIERLKLLEDEESKYILLFALSLGTEGIKKTGLLKRLPGGVITQELIEAFLSNQIAKHGGLELSWADRALGFLPFTGVTSVTIHCARKFYKYYKEKQSQEQLEMA